MRHNIVDLYVAELQKQVKSYEMKLQRLKEAFKTTSQEYREVCYMLLGYKIDLIKSNLYRLSSMYAESEDDYLMFRVCVRTKISFTWVEASLHHIVMVNKGHRRKLHRFQISALDLGVYSAVHSRLFAWGKEPPGIHWIRGFIGPRAGLDVVVKKVSLPY